MYKGNVLLFLLPSLVYRKYLQYSIDITTEQSFRYMEFIDAKIWISKNASLCRVIANLVTYLIQLKWLLFLCWIPQDKREVPFLLVQDNSMTTLGSLNFVYRTLFFQVYVNVNWRWHIKSKTIPFSWARLYRSLGTLQGQPAFLLGVIWWEFHFHRNYPVLLLAK